uniref:Uncharacterized protein n=1 Tax=Acanthochromis polyacanthus TaxID=80966 RepID=A0A3Q1EPA7_9TELE
MDKLKATSICSTTLIKNSLHYVLNKTLADKSLNLVVSRIVHGLSIALKNTECSVFHGMWLEENFQQGRLNKGVFMKYDFKHRSDFFSSQNCKYYI